MRTPAALRGLAVLGVGVVALAVPELSTWLLSLLIGIALVVAGGLEGFGALQKRPIDWPDAGRSLVLILGGVALLALRRLGESAVATLVGLVIGLRGVVDLYGTWRRVTNSKTSAGMSSEALLRSCSASSLRYPTEPSW